MDSIVYSIVAEPLELAAAHDRVFDKSGFDQVRCRSDGFLGDCAVHGVGATKRAKADNHIACNGLPFSYHTGSTWRAFWLALHMP